MPVLEDAKRTFEKITGFRRPKPGDLETLTRSRTPHLFRFADDGVTPNNSKFPLIYYRSPVALKDGFDPAAVFEEVFCANGWKESWRDGIYDFLHFHTQTHEVLGIARGRVHVEFGGKHGKKLTLKAGDVVVLPAGTGHRRLSKSRDLLVVGAYPAFGKYDEPRPLEVNHAEAVARIAKVRLPKKDPCFGKDGPLMRLWRPPSRS